MSIIGCFLDFDYVILHCACSYVIRHANAESRQEAATLPIAQLVKKALKKFSLVPIPPMKAVVATNAGSSFFDTVPSLLSHLRTPSHSNIIQYNYGSIFLFTKTLLMSINGKILGIIAIFIKHNEFFVAS